MRTFAGTGKEGFSGDHGPATKAELWFPHGIALDSYGNLYLADYGNNRVRRVSSRSNTTAPLIITTVAGNGVFGSVGDGGPAVLAQLYNPISVCVDRKGNLFIADSYNHKIRMVRYDTQTIVTIAGRGTAGYGGDGGLARLGVLNVPTSVCVDDSQRDVTGVVQVYLTDSENNRVRRITYLNQSSSDSSGYPLSQGIISTVIGSNLPFTAFGLDQGGSALKATLKSPNGVSVDVNGNVMFADTVTHSIRAGLSLAPSAAPTYLPTRKGDTLHPSTGPTRSPTTPPPTMTPTHPTVAPSFRPSTSPTRKPTSIPSTLPSPLPTTAKPTAGG